MPSRLRRRFLTLAFASVLLIAAHPDVARADTGHVALVGGVLTMEEGDTTAFRPLLRTEIAFRVWGPFEVGGFVQMQTLDLPLEMPSFAGGPLLSLRPDVSFFGFVPSAEIAGLRATLPTRQGRIDAWGVSVGAGVAYEFEAGVGIEARVHHQWYFDMPEDSGVGTDGWTGTLGVTYRLP